ncbi:MAG: hypothetical protein WKF79_03975 [Nocardioides sp.]
MRRVKGAAAAATVLLSGAALTGCGGDSGGGGEDGGDFAEQSADEIVDAAMDAMAGLESVHLTAVIDAEGSQVQLDLSVSTSGDCTGSIVLDGATAELRSVDGEGWFKPEEAFWRNSIPDRPRPTP